MNSFTTKAIAAIAAFESAKAIKVSNMIQAALQTETQGSGSNNIGTPFLYLGPSDHKPDGFADITPGMNLAQTNSGAQAPPANIHDPKAE